MDLDDYTPDELSLEEALALVRATWDGNPETEPSILSEIYEAILIRDGII